MGLREVRAKIRLNGVNKCKKSLQNFFSPGRFDTLYEQKFSNLRPLLAITFPQGFRKSKKFGHWTSGSKRKKTVKQSKKHRYQKKILLSNLPQNKLFFCAAILHPLLAEVFKSETTSFHYFSPGIPKI